METKIEIGIWGGNIASSKEYLEFILGQLSELEEITYRAMVGEFIIYYRGKIVGGIYDDRLLVKPVKVVVKEVYNGVLDFYVDYGFASSIYDDWFWKIFYEKGSKGNKFSIWISELDVYEEQRHMGICS